MIVPEKNIKARILDILLKEYTEGYTSEKQCEELINTIEEVSSIKIRELKKIIPPERFYDISNFMDKIGQLTDVKENVIQKQLREFAKLLETL